MANWFRSRGRLWPLIWAAPIEKGVEKLLVRVPLDHSPAANLAIYAIAVGNWQSGVFDRVPRAAMWAFRKSGLSSWQYIALAAVCTENSIRHRRKDQTR